MPRRNALLHSLKHYKVLHEQNVFLTVEFRDVPWVRRRTSVSPASACATTAGASRRATASWTSPTSASRSSCARPHGLQLEPMEVIVLPVAREDRAGAAAIAAMARWRDRIFAAMARNAGSVTDFFNIPTNRVVELGTRVQI